MKIIKLTSDTGVVYINVDKVACWRERREYDTFDRTTMNTLGSTLIFDDADHFEMFVRETPDQIANLLMENDNAPTPSPKQTTCDYPECSKQGCCGCPEALGQARYSG